MLITHSRSRFSSALVSSDALESRHRFKPTIIIVATQMNISTVKQLLEEELARGEPFDNWHGITSENVRLYLVEPFPVRTDPDDLKTQPRTMWVVLQEYRNPTDGYVVVYDPLSKTWKVAEHVKGEDYIAVITGQSLAQALDGM